MKLPEDKEDKVDKGVPKGKSKGKTLTRGARKDGIIKNGTSSLMIKTLKQNFADLAEEEGNGITVLSIDKMKYPQVAYSSIVFMLDIDDNTSFLMPMFFSETGKPVMPLNALNQAMDNIMSNQGREFVYVQSDCASDVMANLIKEAVKSENNFTGNIVFVPGLMYKGKYDLEDKDRTESLYRLANNTLLSKDIDLSGTDNCETINGLMSESNLNVSVVVSPDENIGLDGSVVATDINILIEKTSIDDDGSDYGEMNTASTVEQFSRVSAVIDAAPHEVIEQSQYDRMSKAKVMLQPSITITDIAAEDEVDLSALLLTIASSFYAIQENIITALTSGENISSVGYYNLITGITNKKGAVIDFSKVSSKEDIIKFITNISSDNVTWSFDVRKLGITSAFLEHFKKASGINGNIDATVAACNKIVDVSIALTDGRFDTNYDINKIIISSKEVPEFLFSVNSSKKNSNRRRSSLEFKLYDILEFMSDKEDMNEVIAHYMNATNPMFNRNNITPLESARFIMNMITNNVPDITNVTYNDTVLRVTLNNDFITELTTASINAGLKVTSNFRVETLVNDIDMPTIGNEYVNMRTAKTGGVGRRFGGDNKSTGAYNFHSAGGGFRGTQL